MALTRDRINDLAEDGVFLGNVYEIAQAIEAEVRKDDDALIQQMLEVLENFDDAGPIGEGWQSDELIALLASARARLEGKP